MQRTLVTIMFPVPPPPPPPPNPQDAKPAVGRRVPATRNPNDPTADLPTYVGTLPTYLPTPVPYL